MATLQALLASPDQSVRLKAALAAGTYPEPDFIEILIEQCRHEPDFFVRDTLSWALMRHDLALVVAHLKKELISNNSLAKSQAIHTLSKIGDSTNYPLITVEMMDDPDELIATTAWRAASVLVPEGEKVNLVKVFIRQLGRGDSDVQFALTRFLCDLGEVIVEPLTAATSSTNELVRTQAEFTLIRYQEMKVDFKKKQ